MDELRMDNFKWHHIISERLKQNRKIKNEYKFSFVCIIAHIHTCVVCTRAHEHRHIPYIDQKEATSGCSMACRIKQKC